jgi:secreted trypsin-like serine protease
MLRSVEVPIQDITKCIKEHRKANDTIPNIEENICAGRLGKDSCQVR